MQPAVKQAAVDVVTALLAYPPGGAGPKAAADRVRAAGQDPALVGTVPGLVGTGGTADTATVGIVDVQYGGILRTSASVLVVCRQWTLTGSTVTSGGTTVDVRLVAATPKWRVTELHPSQPGAEVPRLSAAAGQVLASSRIDLPPASRADILSGQVHDSVLGTMLGLAQSYTLAVSVVRSGHPILVFGTSRPSDHPKGRAFDTWAIDGHPVVEPATPRSLVTGYMSRAAALGSYNVGGPYLLPGSAFFSDDTHHDHVHIGFTA